MTQDNLSDNWLTLPWKKIQKQTYRLHKRIYKASRNGDLDTTTFRD